MNKQKNKKIITVAGPCAAESLDLILYSVKEAKKRNVDFIRTNLWKPRTKPGFEGVGKEGIHFLVAIVKNGGNPGLEIIIPEQAKLVMDTVLPILGNGKLLL